MLAGNDYALEQFKLLDSLARELDTWPAEIGAFESQYEIFGSWILVIRRNGKRTRFVFDGRDRWLEAERLQENAGDFSVPPLSLGGIDLPKGLSASSLSRVVEFIRECSGR